MSSNTNFATRLRAAFQIMTAPSSSNVKSTNCAVCGRKFTWISEGVGRNKKICSEECKRKAHIKTALKCANRRYEEDEEYRKKVCERNRTYQRKRAEEMRKSGSTLCERSWTTKLVCEMCGKEFMQVRTSKSKRMPKYCSDGCRSLHRRQYGNEYIAERYRTDESFREERKEQSRKAYRERMEREKGDGNGE